MSRDYHSRMEIWFRRSDSFGEDAAADADFWARVSPDQRVAILEEMRQEWLDDHGRSDEGLQRIARRVASS